MAQQNTETINQPEDSLPIIHLASNIVGPLHCFNSCIYRLLLVLLIRGRVLFLRPSQETAAVNNRLLFSLLMAVFINATPPTDHVT